MANNSLTTLLNDLIKYQNNSIEILNALTVAATTTDDFVTIKVTDSNNVVQSVSVPSFSDIKSQIEVLNNNVKALAGLGDNSSAVAKLDDGSFRKVLMSSFQKEASDIKNLDIPSTFNKKENWFFESFLNPLLYVSFNLTEQVKFNTEQVEMARYILNLDTSLKINAFNNYILNKNISFNDFSNILSQNAITYYLDKDVINLRPRNNRYWGQFLINEVLVETINNKRVFSVVVDKLTLSDNTTIKKDTVSLKLKDQLVLNTSRFEVTEINSSTNKVTLRTLEGFASPVKGSILNYYSLQTSDVIVDVNVGFNEYDVIFIKPIDPDSKIKASNWSPGVGFYSNNLNITLPNGKKATLGTYYQNEVVDFGSYLYAAVKDKTIPSIYALKPDVPTLDVTNFNVNQINEHITKGSFVSELNKLQVDKTNASAKLDSLDKSINELRNKIQTTQYGSTKLTDSDKLNLNKLINERESTSSLYNSIVNDIISKSTENLDYYNAKWRVRGFFPIPDGKYSDRTGTQEIIQFKIQYRYLSKNGGANPSQQLQYKDVNGNALIGSFSNWVEVLSPLRKKIQDPVTGNIIWKTEDTENPESININQVDIPISSKEMVEFRIKSISEAGWPASPQESNWSNSVIIQFPTEYETTQNVSDIAEQAKKDKVRIDLLGELNKYNVEKIAALSINQNEKFFVSDSNSIASGFLTAENNIISLFDKLNQMSTEIEQLKAKLNNVKGLLSVTIIDELGQEYKVENNQVIKIDAPDYENEAQKLTKPKGAIISKTYFIKISNSNASELSLYARLFGSDSSALPITIADDIDYNTLRKYNVVPIAFSNPNTVRNISPIASKIPFASEQTKGQFIYARYTSIVGDSLYESPTIVNDRYWSVGTTANSLSDNVNNFIFSGTVQGGVPKRLSTNDVETNLDYNQNVWMHILHPEVLLNISGIKNSKFATHQKSLGNVNTNEKICFADNDKYLVGPNSVGSYLFINTKDINLLRVDGNESNSIKNVTFGSDAAILIPITFQYRMTDYSGVGTDGIGNIGGKMTKDESLEYSKTLGIDIYHSSIDKLRFSFDINITAKYKSNLFTKSIVPERTFASVIDDINKTIKGSLKGTTPNLQ